MNLISCSYPYPQVDQYKISPTASKFQPRLTQFLEIFSNHKISCLLRNFTPFIVFSSCRTLLSRIESIINGLPVILNSNNCSLDIRFQSLDKIKLYFR